MGAAVLHLPSIYLYLDGVESFGCGKNNLAHDKGLGHDRDGYLLRSWVQWLVVRLYQEPRLACHPSMDDSIR